MRCDKAPVGGADRGNNVLINFCFQNCYLQDLENTIGSWDMYGQDEKNRYNGLQSEFFERAAGGLTRREYLNGLVALGGAAILIWGAKGSKDANLPITKGPQKEPEVGPRGRK